VDEPRCGALSLLQKPLHNKGGVKQKSCQLLCYCTYVGLGQVVTSSRVLFKRYLIIVLRPMFAAALVVRRRYFIVVPCRCPRRHACTWPWCADRCPRRRSLCVACTCLGRGAKTDNCGHSFAVCSTQVSTVGLRLRHSRLTRGSMLEVSRDAAIAGRTTRQVCSEAQ
jgi:hypothetical protein